LLLLLLLLFLFHTDKTLKYSRPHPCNPCKFSECQELNTRYFWQSASRAYNSLHNTSLPILKLYKTVDYIQM
jgi:hypothetical protein